MHEALLALQTQFQFTVEVVDVDSDPLLEARYGEKVPVLVGDEGNRELCHYFLDLPVVTAFLAKTR